MLAWIGSVFLGWSLGANDAANVFGTAVASRMVRFMPAAFLAAVFVITGAVTAGAPGIETLGDIAEQTAKSAGLTLIAAGVIVTLMTLAGAPVSTSQAVVGAIVGAALGRGGVDFGPLLRIAACWIGTPVGAMAISVFLYVWLGRLLNRASLSLVAHDGILRVGLIVSGCYGAYALGANNVANVAGALVKAGVCSVPTGALVGGLSIAAGVCTLGKPVMMTVGRDLVELDAFCALVVVFAQALTVHVYAILGAPVSSSQAVVGAVLGVGIMRGRKSVNTKTLVDIIFAWIGTPVLAGCLARLLVGVAGV